MFVFMFIWGDPGSRGWYHNRLEASFHSGSMCNPVCVKCVCAWVMRGYCHSDSARFVSVRALCYIFIVPSPTCKFL